MKKLILILGEVLATGCATNKCGITEELDNSTIVFAVDSTGVSEDPNNPGVFYKMYDTIFISIKNKLDRSGRYKFNKNGEYKTSYKILNK